MDKGEEEHQSGVRALGPELSLLVIGMGKKAPARGNAFVVVRAG